AFFLRQFVILLQVSGVSYETAWHGLLVYPKLENHQQMHADERNQHRRNDKHVDREKARQGFTRDDWLVEYRVDQRSFNERNPSNDGGTDAKVLIGILVEAQHLSRERHVERHQQKEHFYNPGQFAWIFIRSEHEYLHHMH